MTKIDRAAPKPDIAPGVYPDLPIEEYHGSLGYSPSQLKTVLKSPYQFHYEYLQEQAERDLTKWGNTRRPLAVGGATAALMDGPDVFDRGYVVLDEASSKASKNSKKFTEPFAALTGAHLDKTVILFQEYEQAKAIVRAIHHHPDAWTRDQLAGFFSNPELRAECSYYWKDSETGLLVKSRPDLLIPRALAVDIKTTSDCGAWTFAKRISEMGHHIQAAMGLDIINHVDQCAIENWMLIVVEQSPPHDVAVYALGKPTLAKGHEKYRYALKTLAYCLDRDEWPGKQAGIEEINLPAYALNEQPQIAPRIDTVDSKSKVIR